LATAKQDFYMLVTPHPNDLRRVGGGYALCWGPLLLFYDTDTHGRSFTRLHCYRCDENETAV